jgi:hypothetical protein
VRRDALIVGLLLLGCVRAPGGAFREGAGANAAVEGAAEAEGATPKAESATAQSEPEAEVEPAPLPKPTLVLVDEDWVWDDGDLGGPLLRIMELHDGSEDPAGARALVATLEPLMICYELELGRRPGLTLTVAIRRVAPTEVDRVGIAVSEDAGDPTGGMSSCVAKALAHALPPHHQDPYGRYTLRFFPRRDQAPPLRRPDPDDAVIEGEGGACFIRETHPCKPHKHCMGPTWARSRCKPP